MKDPAVLFYTADFLSGTYTMSDEQVGKYIRLLCLQHQKGKLTKKDMQCICKAYDVDIYRKFIEEDGLFYNQRMFNEAERRKKYSESRKINAKHRFDEKPANAYAEHMGTVTETITETININNNTEEVKNKWNKFAVKTGLVEVKKITDKRKSGILARFKEKEFNLDEIFAEIERSDFCRGSTGWKVDFDFVFCSPHNYLKIIEGKYRNGSNTIGNRKSDATARATFRHTEEQLKDIETFAESLKRNRETRGIGS
jgi:hypothetical protein